MQRTHRKRYRSIRQITYILKSFDHFQSDPDDLRHLSAACEYDSPHLKTSEPMRLVLRNLSRKCPAIVNRGRIVSMASM